MSYIVLARKYRPQRFDDVIGQDHITILLKKAIESKRIAHAYLFAGPRGVGKTSCARILAKSLNCKNGPTTSPCDKCPACLEITSGTSFDVIEIDGASNRGIDEVRTLRENVKFTPTYGQYKIYIVDEVHMLTPEAFNALLKTLEEPPAHVKFIFATTAPSKVPDTIISRCQRFDFRRISVEVTSKRLTEICTKEKLKVEPGALFAIAKASLGSVRDALSILDQLSALSERQIQAQDVYSMLGMVETQLLFELSGHLAQRNCAAALQVLDKIIDQGKDIRQLSRDLIEHFRNLMVIKVGGKSLGRLIDYPLAIKEMLLTQAEEFSLEKILISIETFIEAQETSRIMGSLRLPLEIAFARLTFDVQSEAGKESKGTKTAVETTVNATTSKSNSPWTSAMDVLTNQKGEVNFSFGETRENSAHENVSQSEKNTTDDSLPIGLSTDSVDIPILDLEKIRSVWDAVTHTISREKMSVATFLQEGMPYDVVGSKITIGFPEAAVFHKESLEKKESLQLIERVFSQQLKTPVSAHFKIVTDYKPTEQHPLVKEALETFKGKIVNKWHKE